MSERFNWTGLSDKIAADQLIRSLNIRLPRIARAIPYGPHVDIRETGASINGKTDDTAAWTKAISRANAAHTAVWHPGGTSKAAIVMPASQQTRIVGPGPGKATILGSVAASHSHVIGEWDCALIGVTVDGDGAATRAVSLKRVTKFLLSNVRIQNVAAAGLALLASYDATLFDVFIRNLTTGADPAVLIDGDATSSEESVQNRSYGLHIEPGVFEGIYLDLVGGATSKTRYNKFYFTKLDGVPGTGAPAHQLLRIGAWSSDTSFWGGDCAYGNGVPQIQISGDRNLIAGFEHLTTAPGPTFAVSLLAGNDNQIVGLRTQNTDFTSGLFNVASGCSRTRFRDNHWPAALANVITDAGFETDFERSHGRVGLTDGANVSLNAVLGEYHDLLAAGSRTILVPTNPVDGFALDLTIKNNTAGAITTGFTGGTDGFSLAGGAWTDPSPGTRRNVRFRYVRYDRRWVEIARTSGDV